MGEIKSELSSLSIQLPRNAYIDTKVVIGGVKLGYAFMADRARLLISSKISKRINIAAGSVMIAVGVFC